MDGDKTSAVRPPGDLVSVSRELSVRPPGVSAVRRHSDKDTALPIRWFDRLALKRHPERVGRQTKLRRKNSVSSAVPARLSTNRKSLPQLVTCARSAVRLVGSSRTELTVRPRRFQ